MAAQVTCLFGERAQTGPGLHGSHVPPPKQLHTRHCTVLGNRPAGREVDRTNGRVAGESKDRRHITVREGTEVTGHQAAWHQLASVTLVSRRYSNTHTHRHALAGSYIAYTAGRRQVANDRLPEARLRTSVTCSNWIKSIVIIITPFIDRGPSKRRYPSAFPE